MIQRYSNERNIIRKAGKVTIKHLIQNVIVRFEGIEINARCADSKSNLHYINP